MVALLSYDELTSETPLKREAANSRRHERFVRTHLADGLMLGHGVFFEAALPRRDR